MVMNKTEKLALSWLKRRGVKDIVFQKHRSPDFLTGEGNFEVKRAYRLNDGTIKVLFGVGQKKVLVEHKAQVLIFSENCREPLDIVSTSELMLDHIRSTILHEVGLGNKRKISWTIDEEVMKKLNEYRRKLYPGLSESAVAEILLRQVLAPSSEIAIANLP